MLTCLTWTSQPILSSAEGSLHPTLHVQKLGPGRGRCWEVELELKAVSFWNLPPPVDDAQFTFLFKALPACQVSLCIPPESVGASRSLL